MKRLLYSILMAGMLSSSAMAMMDEDQASVPSAPDLSQDECNRYMAQELKEQILKSNALKEELKAKTEESEKFRVMALNLRDKAKALREKLEAQEDEKAAEDEKLLEGDEEYKLMKDLFTDPDKLATYKKIKIAKIKEEIAKDKKIAYLKSVKSLASQNLEELEVDSVATGFDILMLIAFAQKEIPEGADENKWTKASDLFRTLAEGGFERNGSRAAMAILNLIMTQFFGKNRQATVMHGLGFFGSLFSGEEANSDESGILPDTIDGVIEKFELENKWVDMVFHASLCNQIGNKDRLAGMFGLSDRTAKKDFFEDVKKRQRDGFAVPKAPVARQQKSSDEEEEEGEEVASDHVAPLQAARAPRNRNRQRGQVRGRVRGQARVAPATGLMSGADAPTFTTVAPASVPSSNSNSGRYSYFKLRSNVTDTHKSNLMKVLKEYKRFHGDTPFEVLYEAKLGKDRQGRVARRDNAIQAIGGQAIYDAL